MISIWIANLADLAFGDPYGFPHPVRLIGLYISAFEKIARRICKDNKSLKLAGVFLTISTVFLSYMTVWALLRAAYYIGGSLRLFVNAFILYTCLAGRCLAKEASKIAASLKNNDINGSRKLLSYIVGRDTAHMNENDISRAVIETVSENASDGIIAPLFYMFLGGAPLSMAYKAINTMDSMVGYKNEKYEFFGWASARLDDIANFIPSRLTSIFMICGAFVLGLDYKNSHRIVKRDCRNHLSPNSGYPEAAAAGALGIMLGGANLYFGKLVVKPSIGDKLKDIDGEDIKKMISLMYAAWIISLIVFSIFNSYFTGIILI
ncbi:adenosylcobinamide-phosphate synthase CbiB [Lutispora saccharofermentans]|uniref:Cobalamin biosynthesis protein CobD n=1 Tax=Lutispora saccharofermentans TaxID=3024236 RepID=A0ABT1NAA1_9FIRM|nr:adenosylcobinamide-phosphate synthase CbiB [Lutispora saccharofermentans]MCQ1528190.1 adenosylcobinamide-phosphate synthase CbiB [Lutispora saccharofermentans]